MRKFQNSVKNGIDNFVLMAYNLCRRWHRKPENANAPVEEQPQMFTTTTVQPHQSETFDIIERAGVYHWRRERPGRSTVSSERFQTPYDAAAAAANLAHANGAQLGPNARRMVGRYFVPVGKVQEVA